MGGISTGTALRLTQMLNELIYIAVEWIIIGCCKCVGDCSRVYWEALGMVLVSKAETGNMFC